MKADKKEFHVQFRCATSERELYKLAAKALGITLSEFLKQAAYEKAFFLYISRKGKPKSEQA